MICEYCGHDNQTGVKFCSNCGAQFPDKPAKPERSDKSGAKGMFTGTINTLKAIPVKKVLMIVAPAIVLIVAVIIIISMLSGPGVSVKKDSISTFLCVDQVAISGNNNAKFTIDGEYESRQTSLDGSKAVILTDYDSNNGGTLWFVTTSGSNRIADDVYACMLSDTGNGVLYLTDFDNRKAIATLYLYDTSSKKSTLIDEDAMYMGRYGMSMFSISPNGKSLSYVSGFDIETEEFTGYIVVDGKAREKLGDKTYAVAISDGGKHLYYAKVSRDGLSSSLYVKSGRSDNRLMSDWNNTNIMLNRDYSQAIIDGGDKSYLSRGGLERERIDGSTIRGLILPRGSQSGGNSTHTTVYGFRSFTNNVIRNDDGLAYFDSSLQVNRISSTANNASSAMVSNDGRTLLYISNNGHLSSIDPTKPDSERTEIGRDVQQFVASSNAKTIYYINDDDELMCVRGDSQVKVSDDVYSGILAMPYKGGSVFFLVDFSEKRSSGELYFSNNGGRKSKVPGGDEVMRVWISAANVFFRTIDDSVYRSSGNGNFALFAEDVT